MAPGCNHFVHLGWTAWRASTLTVPSTLAETTLPSRPPSISEPSPESPHTLVKVAGTPTRWPVRGLIRSTPDCLAIAETADCPSLQIDEEGVAADGRPTVHHDVAVVGAPPQKHLGTGVIRADLDDAAAVAAADTDHVERGATEVRDLVPAR